MDVVEISLYVEMGVRDGIFCINGRQVGGGGAMPAGVKLDYGYKWLPMGCYNSQDEVAVVCTVLWDDDSRGGRIGARTSVRVVKSDTGRLDVIGAGTKFRQSEINGFIEAGAPRERG